MTHADPIEQAAALRADTQQLLAAAPYDAGDAAPRRHIPLDRPTADEQNRALTAELNRHHTALRTLEAERDDLRIQLASVTADRDHWRRELDNLHEAYARATTEREQARAEAASLRPRLALARRSIDGLEADLRTAQRDNRELTAELGQTRADHAAALELLTVYSDAHERIDRARANYATRPRQDAAEPPHSAAGGTEAHHEPTEAHRGAEGADDEPEVDQAAIDATLAQIAADAAQSDADVAAGRVSNHLGDPPPARLHDRHAPDQAGAQDQPLPGAVPITTAEHVELLSGALDATRRDLARASAMADALAAALTAAMRTHDGAGVRPGTWDSWRDLLTEHAGRSTACPTCSGPVRETVGMVCQTCGTDYSTREG